MHGCPHLVQEFQGCAARPQHSTARSGGRASSPPPRWPSALHTAAHDSHCESQARHAATGSRACGCTGQACLDGVLVGDVHGDHHKLVGMPISQLLQLCCAAGVPTRCYHTASHKEGNVKNKMLAHGQNMACRKLRQSTTSTYVVHARPRCVCNSACYEPKQCRCQALTRPSTADVDSDCPVTSALPLIRALQELPRKLQAQAAG